MSQILEISRGVLSLAERTIEAAAQNLANANTYGYKRRTEFAELLPAPDASVPVVHTVMDFAPGKAVQTGNSYDLSIGGKGFFAVRSGDSPMYTRNGQFHRDGQGRLVNAGGLVLQAYGGGDLILRSSGFNVAADGTVIEDGAPVARIGVADFDDMTVLSPAPGGAFTAQPETAVESENPQIAQGMLETANVSSGQEMVAMMAALRRAESGQKLVQVYDEMMGRAITAFSGGNA